MKQTRYILLAFACCFGLQACSLYQGKVKIDVSDFVQKEYIRNHQQEFIPDYYFKGINDYKGSSLSLLYIEHPDGFYNDKDLEFAKKNFGRNAVLTEINGKTFVEVVKVNTYKVDLITGFKKGYLLISLEGKSQAKLNKIIGSIKIK